MSTSILKSLHMIVITSLLSHSFLNNECSLRSHHKPTSCVHSVPNNRIINEHQEYEKQNYRLDPGPTFRSTPSSGPRSAFLDSPESPLNVRAQFRARLPALALSASSRGPQLWITQGLPSSVWTSPRGPLLTSFFHIVLQRFALAYRTAFTAP